MSTILVAGACGFIGWKVCEKLLADGDAVVGVDNLDDAYDVRLKQWRLAQLQGRPGFAFHRVDISDRDGVRSFGQSSRKSGRVDAVVNLAARAGVRRSVTDPWAYVAANVNGTVNLLELCRELDVGSFVLASTSSLYGEDTPAPFREDADTSRPLSPYAASKKAAEAMAYSYHSLHGLDVTVLRFFTVYGPAGRPDMSLFRFVQWISEGREVVVFGDGTQRRDFTYVGDVANGVRAALTAARGYEIINLGSDKPIVLNGRHPADRATRRARGGGALRTAPPGRRRGHLGRHLQGSPAAGLGSPRRTSPPASANWWTGTRRNRDWARDIVT